MEWSQQLEIIEQVATEALARRGRKATLANLAELLDVKVPKLQAWKRGQKPGPEDLVRLVVRLGISPAWLLLGAGRPTQEPGGERLVPEYTAIGDTLHDMVTQLPASLPEVALTGGMTLDELTACMESRALPSSLAVARWVHAYRVNANFLLAQVGQPLLTEEQYEERGPLTWLREKRGDFAEADESPALASLTASRLAKVERTMLDAGASQLDVLRSLRAMLDGEISQVMKRDGYGVAEPGATFPQAAEDPAPFPDQKKAAGGGSV